MKFISFVDECGRIWTVPKDQLFLCAYTRTSNYRSSEIPEDIKTNLIKQEHKPLDGSMNVTYHVCEVRFFAWKQDVSFGTYTQLRDALMAE